MERAGIKVWTDEDGGRLYRVADFAEWQALPADGIQEVADIYERADGEQVRDFLGGHDYYFMTPAGLVDSTTYAPGTDDAVARADIESRHPGAHILRGRKMLPTEWQALCAMAFEDRGWP